MWHFMQDGRRDGLFPIGEPNDGFAQYFTGQIHGACADSWFSHLAIEVPGENCCNKWLEAVSDEQYDGLGK